ncbi:MAG: subclass B3 metallo-beta-lactamase [Vicinamibacterales bacterium]
MPRHQFIAVVVLFSSITGCSAPEPAPAATSAAPATPRPGDPATLVPDAAMACDMCGEWNQPRAPFKVFGNSYFVGTQGLSSVVIATDAGLALIDVALPQSAPLIDANIRTLGLRTTDIKYILTSHAHYDHLGGVRSMQRYTRATVLASASTAQALGLGHPVPEDPQFGTGPNDAFPAVTDARVMKDGETIQLGGTTITAHYTPGHTPGATTWTWQSCEGTRCLNMVYVDSLTAVSKDGYRYTDHPGLVDSYRATMAKVAALPCDVVISTHPSATGMDDKLARRTAGNLAPGAAGDPFVDAGACKALAALSLKNLKARVEQERQRK